MSSILVSNLPEEMVKKLKFSAAVNHTSVDHEVLMCLKQVLYSETGNSGDFSARPICDKSFEKGFWQHR